ncbi:MAG TPA: hypothetical protein VMZ91_10330 [Candidatus Paceibacterota bacterium]|nr:hypothetical protein [Candidatus Paceibacterota bacterium]
MSHFTLLVIGPENEEELEQIMEPFNELDLSQEEMRFDSRAEFNKKLTIEEAEEEYQKFKNTGLTTAPTYENLDNYMDKYNGYSLNPEKTHYGYYSNPNAKWDWYQVGGRWAGWFRVKTGKIGKQGHHRAKDFASITGEKVADLEETQVDQVRIGDIDFEGMYLDKRLEAENNWEKAFEKFPISEDKEEEKRRRADRHFRYDIKKEDTKEKYIEKECSLSTFAVLKDKKWYENGEMGWWGFVSDKKEEDIWDKEFNNLIKNLSPDTMVTLVDCHI